MKPTLGLIGLGLMGQPMGKNLLKAGFPLVVWNRTPESGNELVEMGAKFAKSPRDAASQADVLLMIVSDPPAVEEVLWGPNGAIEGLRQGSVLIDSSTVSPELARREARACAERGVDSLDAPVTGGTWGAESGELVFMIGGEEHVFERVKPVLSALGKHFFFLGPHGSGQTVKLAMNLLLALEVDALAEALELVAVGGVPGERLIDVMQSSMARAKVLDVKAPLMLKSEFPSSFPLRLMHKDLRLALEFAEQKGLDLPAARAAFATYDAVKSSSHDDPDYSGVARYWKKS
jgi:3-hydroxyisobutyrate dehydrogenase-like beta-hydroxyacid dehydrogenase